MKEFISYFSPVPNEIINFEWQATQIGFLIDKHTENYIPTLGSQSIVIFNIPEYEGSENIIDDSHCYVRRAFYQLHQQKMPSITDLGTLNLMSTRKESFEVIQKVITVLLEKNIIPIVLGGGHDITYAVYRAYADIKKYVSLTVVDKNFDIGLEEDKLASHSYFGKIMRHNPSYLFHYTNIGYQTHFVSPAATKMLNKMNFDLMRLGNVKSNFIDVEPAMRNTDFLSFDISAIQSFVSSANIYASPNGLTSEESCKIMHYAGLSDKLSAVGLFEYGQTMDNNFQTSHLLAQMIWYFIEGYKFRKNELTPNLKNCIRYTVAFEDGKNIIVFYKSQLSGRWWMGVPFKNDKNEIQNYFVACSYSDYETANSGEVPDRWLKTYNKFI